MAKRLYTPGGGKPYPLSRSKIHLFQQCPRCFYLDVRLGIARPSSFPFNLNNAVDALLKKEFDQHRESGTRHPYMERYGLTTIPFAHPELNSWRHNARGVRVTLPDLGFEVYGAIDDLWLDQETELLHVVDYKATSKEGEVSLNADWQSSYKRQVEFYQWLLEQRELPISNIAWFVYLNGRKDLDTFDSQLKFKFSLLPYSGENSWVIPTLSLIKETLDREGVPAFSEACEHCQFVQMAYAP